MIKKGQKKVFDLFAGAGGFGLGFKMADFNISLSLEKDDWAIKTLKENASSKEIIIHNDIRNISSRDEIIKATKGIKPNLIIGGPPCQGFSVAGPLKDPDDPRNSLFKEFANWVEVLFPEVFILENVTGLINRKNSDGELVLNIIKKTFQDIGYRVELWKLNAALYGVPQIRNRLFVVGNRFNRVISPPPITHTISKNFSEIFSDLKPAVTVHEAIGDLPYIEAGQGSEQMLYNTEAFCEYQRWARLNSNQVNNHVAMLHTQRVVKRYQHILDGLSMHDMPNEMKVRKRGGDGEISRSAYNSNYRHLKGDMVSYTIPASFYSTFIHSKIPRNITSREAARIQSFPDNYVFKGKRTVISSKLLLKQGKKDQNFLSQYNQIGNAVPPLLAFHIANHINKFLSTLESSEKDAHNSLILSDTF